MWQLSVGTALVIIKSELEIELIINEASRTH